jgi:hypothetical protein
MVLCIDIVAFQMEGDDTAPPFILVRNDRDQPEYTE